MRSEEAVLPQESVLPSISSHVQMMQFCLLRFVGLKHLLEDLAFLLVELLVPMCIQRGFVLTNSFKSEVSGKEISVVLSE